MAYDKDLTLFEREKSLKNMRLIFTAMSHRLHEEKFFSLKCACGNQNIFLSYTHSAVVGMKLQEPTVRVSLQLSFPSPTFL